MDSFVDVTCNIFTHASLTSLSFSSEHVVMMISVSEFIVPFTPIDLDYVVTCQTFILYYTTLYVHMYFKHVFNNEVHFCLKSPPGHRPQRTRCHNDITCDSGDCR